MLGNTGYLRSILKRLLPRNQSGSLFVCCQYVWPTDFVDLKCVDVLKRFRVLWFEQLVDLGKLKYPPLVKTIWLFDEAVKVTASFHEHLTWQEGLAPPALT